MQAAKAALSSEHWKAVTAVIPILPVNEKLADFELVKAFGFVASVNEGAVVLTAQFETISALVFPAPSFARALNECAPAARVLSIIGLVHAAKAPLSIEHSIWLTPVKLSVARNAIVTLAPEVAAGVCEKVMTGAVASTLKRRRTGSAFWFLLSSALITRT